MKNFKSYNNSYNHLKLCNKFLFKIPKKVFLLLAYQKISILYEAFLDLQYPFSNLMISKFYYI